MGENEIKGSGRKAFALGGSATFTIVSAKTGARFTYKVTAKDRDADDTIFFVSLLTGNDNENDFSYLGIIVGDKFRRTAKSRISEDAPSCKAFAWFWTHTDSDLIAFYHEGRCGRCGRKLTVPESVTSGFGPECAKAVA